LIHFFKEIQESEELVILFQSYPLFSYN